MNTFAIGQKVSRRSVCNSDCIFTGTIINRTAKFVTVSMYDGREVNRCKIHIDEEGEFIFPMGQYSMAPIFRA